MLPCHPQSFSPLPQVLQCQPNPAIQVLTLTEQILKVVSECLVDRYFPQLQERSIRVVMVCTSVHRFDLAILILHHQYRAVSCDERGPHGELVVVLFMVMVLRALLYPCPRELVPALNNKTV